MKREERRRIIEDARKVYAQMVKDNPALAELQRRFDLRVDVKAAATERRVATPTPSGDS